MRFSRKATIIGWGKMSLSSVRSPSMQFLEVPLASWDTCLRVYGKNHVFIFQNIYQIFKLKEVLVLWIHKNQLKGNGCVLVARVEMLARVMVVHLYCTKKMGLVNKLEL